VRVPAEARTEKVGQREALDAVYAAIVRTAERLPVFDYDFGDELTGLAALLHELKQ
jgi:hypothetical protein